MKSLQTENNNLLDELNDMKMKYEAAEMARQSAELDSKTAKAPTAAMVAAAQAITKQRKPSMTNDDFSRTSSQRKLN